MRIRFYYPSGIDLTEIQWKKLPNTRTKELIKTKELIQTGFDKIKEHIKEMVKGDGFSFEELNTSEEGKAEKNPAKIGLLINRNAD